MNKKHNYEGINWCECICHQVGKDVKHIRDCCDLCYEKYIDENGVNQALLDIAKKEFLAKKK